MGSDARRWLPAGRRPGTVLRRPKPAQQLPAHLWRAVKGEAARQRALALVGCHVGAVARHHKLQVRPVGVQAAG